MDDVDVKWQVDFRNVRIPAALATLVPLSAMSTLLDFADYYELSTLRAYLYLRKR